MVGGVGVVRFWLELRDVMHCLEVEDNGRGWYFVFRYSFSLKLFY
jgi:hypothetical protein